MSEHEFYQLPIITQEDFVKYCEMFAMPPPDKIEEVGRELMEELAKRHGLDPDEVVSVLRGPCSTPKEE